MLLRNHTIFNFKNLATLTLIIRFKYVISMFINVFDPRCGTYIFTPFRPSFDNVEEKYLNIIKKINDPILRHISLYFVQYYIDGYHYFRDSPQVHRDGACQYLRLWLQEKKDLFTYGGNCKKKKELWESNFKKLWDMLGNIYTITEDNKPRPWCKDYELAQLTILPREVIFSNCDDIISQEHSSKVHSCPTVQKECNCSVNETPISSPETVPPQEAGHPPETDQLSGTDRTKNLAVTSGFTAVGTLGTLFFLYRFTPMMSWFRRPGMNNVGTDLYMNPGGAESFLSMQQDNGSNNLFYHP
ncbi:PIR protein [Plasmodium vivax]|uniref:VIR protein n=1 Tax=Plasmodium vivax TaxID=5855 RepID=A0A565A698_PLAVI|nr:PIR protein [Plasmodium vivax]